MKEGSFIIKRIFKVIVILIVSFSILLILLNPGRGSFNNAVFEGGPNSITKNQAIQKKIIELNTKDYNNDNHPLIKRRNYYLYSIYDVYVSNTEEYHILGILESFQLLNE